MSNGSAMRALNYRRTETRDQFYTRDRLRGREKYGHYPNIKGQQRLTLRLVELIMSISQVGKPLHDSKRV